MTIFERITQRRIELGLEERDLYKHPIAQQPPKITRGNVGHWKAGANKISTVKLFLLKQILKTTEDWIMKGIGTHDSVNPEAIEKANKPTYSKRYPLLSLDGAHKWSSMEVKESNQGYTTSYISDECIAIKIESESMQPYFTIGDTVLVDCNNHPKSNQIALIKDDASCYFRKLLFDGGKRFITTTHPDWPTKVEELSDNQTIFGVAVEVRRVL